jgi:flagella basal body P-ring formation protein FlgA
MPRQAGCISLFIRVKKIMSLYMRNLIFFCVLSVALVGVDTYAAAEQSPREKLNVQLLEWLLSTQAISSSEVTLGELDRRVQVPECADGFEFTLPFNDKNTVRVSCAAAGWSVITRATFRPQMPTASLRENESLISEQFQLIASRQVGDIVTSADVRRVTDVSLLRGSIGRGVALSQIIGAKVARDMSAGTILKAGDLQFAHKVLTVAIPVQRGTALSESNTLEMIFYGSLPADAVSSVEDLRRMVATTQLRPNQPIRLSNLRQLADVMRGDEIVLAVSRGPVTIETLVIALEQGVIGQQIRVENPESGEIFQVIVTDVRRAEPR